MPNAHNGARAGRTLAELLVTLAVSGILFALLTAAFIAHERLVSGSTAIAEARGQVRQAHHIIPAILRAASLPVGDIQAVHDTLVELDYPIATGVVCAASSPARIVLAPDSIAIGQRLASWIHVPRAGDLAHVFDPGALPGASDDRWWVAAVGGVVPLPNGCAGSPFLDRSPTPITKPMSSRSARGWARSPQPCPSVRSFTSLSERVSYSTHPRGRTFLA